YGNIFPFPDFSSLPDRYFFKRGLPVNQDSSSARIADNHGMLHGWKLSGVHEITQLRFIHRGANNHIRDATHISNIVGSLMSSAIFSYQSCTVQAKDNR